jgi:hypothetical protein
MVQSMPIFCSSCDTLVTSTSRAASMKSPTARCCASASRPAGSLAASWRANSVG